MRLLPTVVSAATLVGALAGEARAEERCRFDGVRILMSDAGDASIVELSARIHSLNGQPCTVDWSRVSLASPSGEASPTIAVSQTFHDHKIIPPLSVADGVAAVQPREARGASGVFALRWFVEGTASGLRIEVPRSVFPKAADPGARVERRVKSARTGTAKFGALGDLPTLPSAPGPAGGAGPTGPADEERVVVEFVPSGPVLEPIPAPLLTLEAMRGTFPLRVLDLAAANEDGWNEVAKRAYAAAIHGDPLVASMGVHALAWLGSGLSLQATHIGKTAAGPDTAVLPASVIDTIGDVDGRLQKRMATVGHLLPLGRSAVFRKALAGRPWDEAPRAAAAKAAIARLATVQPQDLAAFLVPSVIDGMAAPIDPPTPVPVAGPPQVMPNVPALEDAGGADVGSGKVAARKHGHSRKRLGLFFGLLAAAAVLAWQYRESRD